MKFEYRHSFDVSVETLIDAMFHPDLPAHLADKMTTIVRIEVLERTDDDATIKRRVKYVPVPMIKKIGTKKITPEAMEWVEESTFERRTKVMTFANIPTHPKIRAKMTNAGRIEFLSRGADRCERVMSGELNVKFPILGRIAEGMISKNANKILDEEAEVLARWIRERG